jgi:hypothetical protein
VALVIPDVAIKTIPLNATPELFVTVNVIVVGVPDTEALGVPVMVTVDGETAALAERGRSAKAPIPPATNKA